MPETRSEKVEKRRAMLEHAYVTYPEKTAKELHAIMAERSCNVPLSWVVANLTPLRQGISAAEYRKKCISAASNRKTTVCKKDSQKQMQIELPNSDTFYDLIKKLHECMQKRYIRRIEILDTGDVSVEAVENFKV